MKRSKTSTGENRQINEQNVVAAALTFFFEFLYYLISVATARSG